jgi:hypothetical protein
MPAPYSDSATNESTNSPKQPEPPYREPSFSERRSNPRHEYMTTDQKVRGSKPCDPTLRLFTLCSRRFWTAPSERTFSGLDDADAVLEGTDRHALLGHGGPGVRTRLDIGGRSISAALRYLAIGYIFLR